MGKHEVMRYDGTVGGMASDYSRDYRPLRFEGEELWLEQIRSRMGACDDWRLYRTQAGTLVVVRDHSSCWQGSRCYQHALLFESIDALRGHSDAGEGPSGIGSIPETVLVAFERILGLNPAEVVE